MSSHAFDALAHVAELLAILLVALFGHVNNRGTRKAVRAQVETVAVEVKKQAKAVRESVASLRPPGPGCANCEHSHAAHISGGCGQSFCGCPHFRAPPAAALHFDGDTPPRGSARADHGVR